MGCINKSFQRVFRERTSRLSRGGIVSYVVSGEIQLVCAEQGGNSQPPPGVKPTT